MYAPTMAEIWAGRYERSRNDDAEMGGPLPGGGAGASQMLMCHMFFGEAVVALKRRVWTRAMYERGRSEGIVILKLDIAVSIYLQGDAHAEAHDACSSSKLERGAPYLFP